MIPQIAIDTSDAVRRALSQIGRTEDLRFSPDNRILAIAGFAKHCCLLLRVKVHASANCPKMVIRDFLRIYSSGIGQLHGLDFIDRCTLAFANRDGLLSIVKLPKRPWKGRTKVVEPRLRVFSHSGCELHSPGSVAVLKEASGSVVLLTCENFAHCVMRHEVDPNTGYTLQSSQVLCNRGLNIPDGISISHDGRWIAVSSHNTHDVKLYPWPLPSGLDTRPAGVLCEAGYPHGLRFTPDDGKILVADAGGRGVHVFERGASWQGEHWPEPSAIVIDEQAFERGRFDPDKGIETQEGGPKGIDIDKTGSVVVTTCEEQPLAVFSLSSILGRTLPERSLPIEAARRTWKLMNGMVRRISRAAG